MHVLASMAENGACVKKIKTGTTKCDETSSTMLQPVLADEYTAPISLVDMYICQVRNKKDTSGILRVLTSSYPLDKYPFLKRVRSQPGGDLQVILCPLEDAPPLDKVLTSLEPFSTSLGPPCPAKIPGTPPLTRTQFEACLQYWPVNFHEDKTITKLVTGTYFDTAGLEVVKNHMAEALRLAEVAKSMEQVPIGAVIVDPKSNTVVAKSHDLRHGNHPLQHATMVAIDMVAQSQGGGMWSYKGGDAFFSARREVSTTESEEDKSYPYLCTGYHLYITREPCVMCTMALVHSRIEAVFYGSSYSEGALGSKYKLHVQQGLNHHYRVFKGLLQEKCDQLYASS